MFRCGVEQLRVDTLPLLCRWFLYLLRSLIPWVSSLLYIQSLHVTNTLTHVRYSVTIVHQYTMLLYAPHEPTYRDGRKYIGMYLDTKYRYWVRKCIVIQSINTGLRNVFEIQIRILYLKIHENTFYKSACNHS